MTAQDFYTIPATDFVLEDYVRHLPEERTFIDRPYDIMVSTSGFEVSEMITLRMYTAFLESLGLTLGTSPAKPFLSDSLFSPVSGVWEEYVTNKKFLKHPVVGVNWDHALRYCLWRTRQEQPDGPLRYFYRLPSAGEWLAARHHLDERGKRHDFDGDFADWLLNYHPQRSNFFRTVTPFLPPDYDTFSPDGSSDLFSTKERTRAVLGGNFHHRRSTQEMFESKHYRIQGYRYVSFRMVRVPLDPKDEESVALLKIVTDKMNSYE